MKTIIALGIACALFSMTASAEELSQEKRAAIDTLLVESGAVKMADGMGQAYFHMRRQKTPNLDSKASEIMEDEVMRAMRDELLTNGALNKVAYPVYHKYFSLSEITELVEFYKSPLGKKFLSVMPVISKETTQGVSAMARSLTPQLESRLKARFDKEGIELAP